MFLKSSLHSHPSLVGYTRAALKKTLPAVTKFAELEGLGAHGKSPPRMSDLLALQPNIDIKLFPVAPDERREKVKQEILRPTFSLSEKPLAEVCGFIGFGKLTEKLEGIRKLNLASSLKEDLLMKTAEFFAAENGD